MPQVSGSQSRPSSSASKHFAIIGAGITGLSAAQRLLADDPTAQVTIFEKNNRAGGIIQTIHEDGFLLELGPDSFITNKPAAIRLCQEIGFENQLIPTDNQHRRSLVLSDGKPVAVPAGFMLMAPSNLSAIAKTDVLSKEGRLRLLQESQIPAARQIEDESLANFVRRRFGRETLDRLVQPLVGGIYTSDPEKLSIKATLPRFQQMEQRYGSVTVGTLLQNLKGAAGSPEANGNADHRAGNGDTGNKPAVDNVTAESTASSGARYGLFAAPQNGMSSLFDALQAWVTKDNRCQIRLGTSVVGLQHDQDWTVQIEGQPNEKFDAVIVALPTHQASQLLMTEATVELKQKLAEIEYASSVIMVSTHQISDFAHPLDAFGLVIPMRERRDILAVSFSSRKFPGRAPDGSIILRTFVGGATQPHLVEKPDDEIRGIVNGELRRIFGMKSPPTKSWIARYHRAMPQYHIGHIDRVAVIEQLTAQIHGLELAGSAYHGVGIPDSVDSGQKAALRILNS
ncbi:MAG: protoporphyrinogen oxidase [Fuerstiella sp.]